MTPVSGIGGKHESLATRGASATIRAFFFWPLIKELTAGNFDTDAILHEHGLSDLDVRTPYAALPLSKFVALAESVAKSLRRPFLGLEIGEKFTLADLGPFYALFTLAADLRSALNTLSRYQWVWQTNTNLELVHGRETSTCRYLIDDSKVWPRRQDAEFALTSICMIIRHLTSSRWNPVHVQFEHSVTSRAQRLRRFFRAPVTGSGAANILTIRNEDLDRPLRWGMGPHDATLLPILERHLLALVSKEASGVQTVPERVDAYIARTLGRGPLSLEDAAAHLGVSARSLRRHLANDGTSFRALLQAQRLRKVEAVLGDGRRPLANLAELLGYSDPTVLSRAFKLWTGSSPTQYSRRGSR